MYFNTNERDEIQIFIMKKILPLVILTSLVAQMVKCLPAMWETWVRSLGQEDPLEKEMATHSSILAWKIPWMEEPGRLQSMGLQRVGHSWVTSLHFILTLNKADKTSSIKNKRLIHEIELIHHEDKTCVMCTYLTIELQIPWSKS